MQICPKCTVHGLFDIRCTIDVCYELEYVIFSWSMNPFVFRIDPITIIFPIHVPRPLTLPPANFPSVEKAALPGARAVDLPSFNAGVEMPDLDVPIETSNPPTPFASRVSMPAPQCAGACYAHAAQADRDSVAVRWGGFRDPSVHVFWYLVGVFTTPEPSRRSTVVPFRLAYPSHAGYVLRGLARRLDNGKVYYVVVRGVNLGFGVVDRPAVFAWNGNSGPIVPAVWSSVVGTRLDAGWVQPVDPEAGVVAGAYWAVGTDPRAPATASDVMDWTPIMHLKATTAAVSGLEVCGLLPAPPLPLPCPNVPLGRCCIGKGGVAPLPPPFLQGSQPMPSHCPPDAKCRTQRHS